MLNLSVEDQVEILRMTQTTVVDEREFAEVPEMGTQELNEDMRVREGLQNRIQSR